PGEVHHAGVLVNHHQPTGAEHRAGLGEGIEIHRQIDFRGGEKRTGAAAGDDGLQLFTAAHTPGDFLDHALEVEAHGQLVDAGAIDVSGDAKEARASVLDAAQAGIPFAAAANHGRHRAERLDVIDHGGTAVKADRARAGRADARVAALPLERFHQRGFRAAFVGAGAGVGTEVEIEAAAQDVAPEEAGGVGLNNRRVQDIKDVAVFPSDIDVAALRTDRAPGD